MVNDNIAGLRIERIIAGGMGLGRIEGRPVFTEYAAPGDLLKVRITEEKKGWSKAELLEIVEASPLRVNPACPLYGNCGGCNLQHLDHQAQLGAKEAILRESFRRIGGQHPPNVRIRSSKLWEYRNRIQFHLVPGEKNALGLKERKGKDVIPLDDCPVADPGIRRALKNRAHELFSRSLNNERFSVFSAGACFLCEGGKSRGRVCLKGKEILLDAGVFFQSNTAMLEQLISDLESLDYAGQNLPLGDIYCGVGTFAAFLGERFSGVELVEENPAAIAMAKENVSAKNLNFHAMSSEEWVKTEKPGKKPFGLMIVDPPRSGLSKLFRQYLINLRVRMLAYVSCDPATLARDSKDLVAGGFRLEELYMYDFYPQTSHIESLAVFIRVKSGTSKN